MDKELLRQEYVKAWGADDKRMIDYCMRQADVVIELENGGYIVLDKPQIETTFCFGYGWYGLEYAGDYEDAHNKLLAIHEAENFKKENLSDIDGLLDMMCDIEKRNYTDDWWKEHPWWLKYSMKGFIIYKSQDGCNLYDFTFRDEEGIKRIENVCETYTPTLKDIDAIISGLQEQRAKFEKRLDRYLKKYGTSKLNTWTYLID